MTWGEASGFERRPIVVVEDHFYHITQLLEALSAAFSSSPSARKAPPGSDQEPPARTLDVPWQSLLRYREAWAFCIGKMFTDPVWWFYLTWLPSYLQRERGVTLASAAGALLVIYLAADLGSVFGGWLPGFFLRRGWSGTRARLARRRCRRELARPDGA